MRWGGNLIEHAKVHTSMMIASIFPHQIAATPAPVSAEVITFTPELTAQDTLVKIIDRTGEAAGGVTPRAMRDRALVELLYGAGLRVSECCGLDGADVDLDRQDAAGVQQRCDVVDVAVDAAGL